MVVGIISAIIQGSLIPCYAILFGEYIKILSKDDDEAKDGSDLLAILFLVLGLAAGATMFLQMFMFAISGEALTARLRKMTFNAMLKQEMGWYDDTNNNIGALCARLAGDAAHVQGVSSSKLPIKGINFNLSTERRQLEAVLAHSSNPLPQLQSPSVSQCTTRQNWGLWQCVSSHLLFSQHITK